MFGWLKRYKSIQLNIIYKQYTPKVLHRVFFADLFVSQQVIYAFKIQDKQNTNIIYIVYLPLHLVFESFLET